MLAETAQTARANQPQDTPSWRTPQGLTRLSWIMVGVGIAGYLLALLPPLLPGLAEDYGAASRAHLYLRGVLCAVAATGIVAGLWLNRPARPWPWILITILVASFCIRPLMAYFAEHSLWDGWFTLLVITVQSGVDIAALAAIVHARRTGRITHASLELAVLLLAYAAFQIPYAAIPGWYAKPSLPISIAMGIVTPVTYVVIVGLLGRLIFVDRIRGPAFGMLMVAWTLNVLADSIEILALREQSAFGMALLDTFIPAAFLWAAASLHPSMHEVTATATEVRGEWALSRTAALWLALVLPPIGLMADGIGTIGQIAVLMLGALAAALVIVRMRQVIKALAAAERARTVESRTDPLTGLLNRRGLIEYVERNESRMLGLVYVDIDSFKLLNDVNGHEFGDKLLVSVAKRLRTLPAPFAASTRIGGDEFALLYRFEEGDHTPTLDALGALVTSWFDDPLTVDHQVLRITASVGCSAICTTASVIKPQECVLDLLRRADIAQYYAKRGGGGRHCSYSDQLQSLRSREQQIVEMLGRLDSGRETSVAYQAVVDMRNGRIVGAEALLRIESATLGTISPAEFIAVAGRRGFGLRIGQHVFETVLSAIDALQGQLPPRFRVAVNCSPQQLQSDVFADWLIETVRQRPPRLETLRLEISESALMAEDTIRRIVRLKRAGFEIAIDDFGSQHAALQHLGRFDVDVLKLDRSFTERLGSQSMARSIVRHVIELAHELHIEVVTEGIECDVERDTLLALGGRYGQGYLWDLPQPGLERFAVTRTLAVRMPPS